MNRTRATWSDAILLRVGAAAALLIVVLGAACGRAAERAAPTGATTRANGHTTVAVVSSVGSAPVDASEMVDWALGRFERAGLDLPARVSVTFDASGAACDPAPALCHPDAHPPEVIVCEPGGASAYEVTNRQITLLHELAHLWHWHRRDGWSDESPIVGGVLNDEVDWHDRTAERVALVVSWGLLETKRRPVRTDLHCADLYVMFDRLTGRPPLGELEEICLPGPERGPAPDADR